MNTAAEIEQAGSINICGLLVHARPENVHKVQHRLLEFEGVEVHDLSDDGRMVVTIDKRDPGEMIDTINSINTVEGILSAAMVYQHHE